MLISAKPEYTVKWKTPTKMFCSGKGSKWAYQESESILDSLNTELQVHYHASFTHSGGKTLHPLFMVCSGAGTGKSRLLDNFKDLAVKATSNIELKEKLKKSYVIKIDLENGTSAGNFSQPQHYLSSRFYHQIIHPSVSWLDMNSSEFPHMSIPQLIEKLADAEGIYVQNMVLIILVDGLQKLPHVPLSRETVLYQVLCTLADLSNNSGKNGSPFVICCISATLETPISRWVSFSRQRYCHLSPPKIDGSEVLHPRDYIERLMVSDMGGHGCALELLSCALPDYRQGKPCLAIMEEICTKLKLRYQGWWISNDKTVLQAILLGQKFPSPESLVGSCSVDTYQSSGLIRWDRHTKRLECPFIWFKLVVEEHGDLMAILDANSSYKAMLYVDNPVDNDMPLYWQHWEDFVARFWCLKTSFFANEEVEWRSLHAGALFKDRTSNPKVFVKALNLVTADSHCSTKSSSAPSEIFTNIGSVKPKDGNHHIRSAVGNPAADSFCFITERLPGGNHSAAYSMSCKNVLENRTLEEYKAEYDKAASNDDFFMEFSTSDYSFDPKDLPSERCGIVCKSNFATYFGPFSGRAYLFLVPTKPNINSAPLKLLRSVDGIGTAIARNIVRARTIERLRDEEDAINRVPYLGPNSAKLFKYD